MPQQSIITVNASRCGAGKTTQDIYPRIRRLLRGGQRVIAVVPSVKLALDYQQALEDSVMIISNAGEGVDKRLITAIAHREACIIITHAAFLQHIWSKLDRQDYHLILDEVFEPFKFTRYKVDRITEIKTQFQLEPILLKGNWFPVSSPPWRDHAAYRESQSYRDLTNNNWWAWQSKDDNANLHAGKWAEFGLELRREHVIDDWQSIHIAAAKFEDTFLAAWMRKEGLVWRITEEFEPHRNADIVWHTFDFKWSKTRRENSPELHEQYRDYVNAHAGTDKVIAIRNSDAKAIKLDHEVEVNHNCHGLNDYRDITRVSIESSLNMHPEHQRWLEEILEMTPAQIKRARTTYTHYQVIMRCALRVSGSVLDPVHVYSCDETVTAQLQDYFDGWSNNLVTIPSTHVKREEPLTNNERNRIWRWKRNNPEYANLDSREILRLATSGLKPSMTKE
jgi:hypothetical protein